ncbi:helicase, partial [Halorubrum sp. Atlit-9R]
ATEPIFPAHTDKTGPNRELYSEQPANDDPVGVRTEMVPLYEQSRYLSRNPDDIAAPMDVLAGDESDESMFDCLEALAAGMEDAVADYREIKSEMVSGKSSEAAAEFDKAVAGFEADHERVLAGIECLKQDPRARRAFKYMNESFQELGFDKWRTFQIVFILMTIPDMLKEADEAGSEVSVSWDNEILETQLDVADVVYFPTGGGKTEAYLGLVPFTAF